MVSRLYFSASFNPKGFLGAFAVDRESAGILFLLEIVGVLANPDACEAGVKRARARKRQTLSHSVGSGFDLYL